MLDGMVDAPTLRDRLLRGLIAVATLLAVYLIELSWVKLGGAAYLLYLPYAHFFHGEEGNDRRAPKPAKAILGLSAFWATVVKIALADIVFAICRMLGLGGDAHMAAA